MTRDSSKRGRTKRHRGRAGRPYVVIVMPAYNAAQTLERTVAELSEDVYDHLILVDDHSRDDTVRIAKRLDLEVIEHDFNIGYGGNQKTCYLRALERGADIVVMLHPDYQYDPRIAGDLVAPIEAGEADVVLASRMLGDPLSGGMPLYKFIANRTLTFAENLVLGAWLSEYHTGYRAYSRRVLETVNFLHNSNDFIFDNEFLAQVIAHGFKIVDVPVRTHYAIDSSSVGFAPAVVYGFGVLGTMARGLAHRLKLVDDPMFRRRGTPSDPAK